MTPAKMGAPHNANIDFTDFSKKMVLPDRIELSTSPLPMEWAAVRKPDPNQSLRILFRFHLCQVCVRRTALLNEMALMLRVGDHIPVQ